jgi:hypothetical protein
MLSADSLIEAMHVEKVCKSKMSVRNFDPGVRTNGQVPAITREMSNDEFRA